MAFRLFAKLWHTVGWPRTQLVRYFNHILESMAREKEDGIAMQDIDVEDGDALTGVACPANGLAPIEGRIECIVPALELLRGSIVVLAESPASRIGRSKRRADSVAGPYRRTERNRTNPLTVLFRAELWSVPLFRGIKKPTRGVRHGNRHWSA